MSNGKVAIFSETCNTLIENKFLMGAPACSDIPNLRLQAPLTSIAPLIQGIPGISMD